MRGERKRGLNAQCHLYLDVVETKEHTKICLMWLPWV